MNVIVLAGGRSRRMGRDKASLTFLGLPLAVQVVERLRPCARRIIVVANDGAPYLPPGIEVVSDLYRGRGPLGGLHAGLAASDAELNLVAACDLPFADPSVALLLAACLGGADAAVPVVRGRPQPLHAVYRRRCLAAVEEHLEAGHSSLVGLLERLEVRWVGEEELRALGDPELVFLNVNTPQDVQAALALARTGGRWAGCWHRCRTMP